MDNTVDKVDNSRPAHLFANEETVFGLFAKEPIPGQVKTRLAPPLSAEQACRLYQVALEETVARVRAPKRALVLCYAGRRSWFEAAFPGLPLLAQQGPDLGARLQAASAALFAAGAGSVLLLGSDSPDLPLELLEEAKALLHRAEVVTIPCRDGGYALIGLRRPRPQLFTDIPWSSVRVLAETRERARQLGLNYRETAPWEDLDEVAALQRLLQRSPQSRTARYIRRELAGLW